MYCPTGGLERPVDPGLADESLQDELNGNVVGSLVSTPFQILPTLLAKISDSLAIGILAF
jgi:hypothetical protein